MELKIPQLTLVKIAQLGRHGTVNTRSEHYSPRVAGSIPVSGNFFLNLLCTDTILAELPELSILGKTRLGMKRNQLDPEGITCDC